MGRPVDVFGGWTFQQTLPDLWAYAQQAYDALAPLAWVVGGILVGSIVIGTIINVVRAAVGHADE